MARRGARVEIGAIQAAWDQVCILRSADNQSGWPALIKRIEAATARYGAGELLRGTIFLITGALDQIGAGRTGRDRFAERFTDTLMRKIVTEWAEAVESTDLPTVRQVVELAFQGRDPVAWRDQAGPVPDSEAQAMGCALALIADFVDRVDGPGACERALLAGLASALD